MWKCGTPETAGARPTDGGRRGTSKKITNKHTIKPTKNMKLKLITRETTAELLCEAESEFEREMLDHLINLPKIDTVIDTTRSYGRLQHGYVKVTFSTSIHEN
jgi:hypothetical protein